ncbi:hypothetical protein BsWGS_18067 [Bradybaena similaris]
MSIFSILYTPPVSKTSHDGVVRIEVFEEGCKCHQKRPIRNDDIRKKVKTTPCMDYIEKQKIRWFGHLVRMNPAKPPLQTYTSRRPGYRAKGRPRKRWTDNIAEILIKHGMTMTDATQKAKDRKLQLPTTLHSTSGKDNRQIDRFS